MRLLQEWLRDVENIFGIVLATVAIDSWKKSGLTCLDD